jgi:hypothetical protein
MKLGLAVVLSPGMQMIHSITDADRVPNPAFRVCRNRKRRKALPLLYLTLTGQDSCVGSRDGQGGAATDSEVTGTAARPVDALQE